MSNKLSKTGWVILIILVVLLVAGFFIVKENFFSNIDETSYYAVFLTNEQVYFGNIKKQTERELVLVNVYYLQLENKDQNIQTQTDQSKFTLVKLGGELHGPTDEMFINNQNILFYEKLRDDSKVVKSILENK